MHKVAIKSDGRTALLVIVAHAPLRTSSKKDEAKGIARSLGEILPPTNAPFRSLPSEGGSESRLKERFATLAPSTLSLSLFQVEALVLKLWDVKS